MIFEGTKNQFFFGLELTRAGSSDPSTTNLIALASLFDITPEEMLKEIR